MSIALKQLRKEAIIFCPLCDKNYRLSKMKVIENTGETALVHSHCPRCQGAVLSLLYTDFLGVTMMAVVTDMNYDDTMRIKSSGIVEEDDVLEAYKKIN